MTKELLGLKNDQASFLTKYQAIKKEILKIKKELQQLLNISNFYDPAIIQSTFNISTALEDIEENARIEKKKLQKNGTKSKKEDSMIASRRIMDEQNKIDESKSYPTTTF